MTRIPSEVFVYNKIKKFVMPYRSLELHTYPLFDKNHPNWPQIYCSSINEGKRPKKYLCDRCKMYFFVQPGFRPVGSGPCNYHPLPLEQSTEFDQSKYLCCGSSGDSQYGCCYAPVHVFSGDNEPKLRKNYFMTLPNVVNVNYCKDNNNHDEILIVESSQSSSSSSSSIHPLLKRKTKKKPYLRREFSGGTLTIRNNDNNNDNNNTQHLQQQQINYHLKKVYALDCKMVYTKIGLELARVTVINYKFDTVYERLVKPRNYIIDYNTECSGLTFKDLIPIRTRLKDVQRDLQRLFRDTDIIIGHSLDSCFKALRMYHYNVIDIVQVFPHERGLPFRQPLPIIVQKVMNRQMINDRDEPDTRANAVASLELIYFRAKQDQDYLSNDLITLNDVRCCK